MKVNLLFMIQIQNKDPFLLLFLLLNFLGILKCIFDLYHMRKKFDTYFNKNEGDFISTLHSLLFSYILLFEKEHILCHIDIPDNLEQKIQLNKAETEDLLFVLDQLCQTAFKLVKKSNIKQFFFSISLNNNTFTLQISHSISNKDYSYDLKKVFGNEKQLHKVQEILNKHSHFQIFTEIVGIFIHHKIIINTK